VFTSFVVGHVFESPQALLRVVSTHYSSQLTKQVFGILGSLAILGAPADFISNVGTGVRDFFYEPIQGAVHGPRQFIEGLEAGTQSLARGVFVGVVRGAANVTDAVNSNLAGLTADDDFIDERKAHKRLLTDAMSRGATTRTFGDSLQLACASVARGLKSGAVGIIEQPSVYASKHGPVGFLKGIGKAMVGAVVKPVVGIGDGAVLVMNHMSDATSKKEVIPKIPKRLRRALPSRSSGKRNNVSLEPYDERAAKAQKVVTGGESMEDVYLGHINIPSHLIIASEQCLWAIDRRSRDPWCVSWDEISHFNVTDGGVRVIIFSQTGLKTYIFDVENQRLANKFQNLLSMQLRKMVGFCFINITNLIRSPSHSSDAFLPDECLRAQ
jgi:Vacuolar-sorting-associated 13 protein C-terminal